MKALCDMTWEELDSFLKKATGISTPPQGAPMSEFYEWFVASTLIGGSIFGGRTEAIQYAREQFDKDPDGAKYHAILDRVLSGEMGSLAAEALAKAPDDAPAAVAAPAKPKRRRAAH